MMIAGTGLAVAGFGSLPFAEFLFAALQAGWLLATYTIAWLGLALYFVNSIPFLMNATGPGEHTHAFSVRTALGPLAGFAGSLVGCGTNQRFPETTMSPRCARNGPPRWAKRGDGGLQHPTAWLNLFFCPHRL